MTRIAALPPRTLSAQNIDTPKGTAFAAALAGDAQKALKLFATSNPAITESIAATGGRISAFVKDSKMFILALPFKGNAVLYALDASGKATRASETDLSKLASLYNEKTDADSGRLMSNLREAFSRIRNVPSSHVPGAPKTDQERRIDEAVHDAEQLGSTRALSFVGEMLDVEENLGKGYEELMRRMETEIKSVSDTKRKDLPVAISALEDDLSKTYDSVSLDFGGL